MQPIYPVTELKLNNLMRYVDDSFWPEPRLDRHECGNVYPISGLIQWLWARNQEWLACLEEIEVHMETLPFDPKHYYYIGKEFKCSNL